MAPRTARSNRRKPADPAAALGEVGINLRAARKKLKLTQEDTAARCGVHATEVSRIEAGKRDPRITTLLRLAEALEVPAGSLLP